ncbi:MAG: hypothetical protein ACLGJC_11425 [Alphaproteobacteria bacterium]
MVVATKIDQVGDRIVDGRDALNLDIQPALIWGVRGQTAPSRTATGNEVAVPMNVPVHCQSPDRQPGSLCDNAVFEDRSVIEHGEPPRV